ncbi:protein kinase domain-containing protein [Cupriavidus neocaledonicus]|uniref:Protein kinase family protein n=1 Tax=Cupriavidus neocaledonicus TaxID=1040979 RepID=A0A375H457_9BURK|nr:protein kinase [Cupriavidus neocaledonicus]SPD46711.1 Protein kinase family protein [Cupriavidus neocaledonicus]
MLPDRYKPLTATLIPGGFGAVQPVHDTYLDRTVLFKSMHDADNNAQLANEVRALSRARSRHVVEIYDVITDRVGAVQGIIIELLEGRDYVQFWQEAPGDIRGYLKALYQIALALSDLHAAGIVHRDIKLENLKDSVSGILKLFDFGISTTGADYRTVTNRGTMVYAAPELYMAGAAINSPMDIYAFGICAWALASPALPAVLLEMPPQQSGVAPSIKTALPDLPEDVAALLDACLATEPSRRPSAASLRSLLGAHLIRWQHRGLFVADQERVYELSDAQRNVRIKIGNLGVLKVSYDGLVFRIDEVVPDVFVNNAPALVGATLPDSCVLTFGADRGRQWVTFSSSHPEVML